MPSNMPAPPDSIASGVQATHLLVVDDDAEITRLLTRYFSTHGFRVSSVGDGAQMRQLLASEAVDIVMLDLGLPGEDGLALTRHLREHWHGPVIIITGRGETVDRVVGLEMGADDYITKPFDDIELLNAVEIRLKKYDILQNKYAAGEKGAAELITELNAAGMLDLDPNNYDTVELPKKQHLYQEGRRPKYVYYLLKGKIKAYRIHEDGKEYITNLYAAGDYIGYLPLLDNNPYENSAVVLEEAELAQIPKDEFLNALYKDIRIATRFIRLIAQNVQEKEERLLQLAYGSLRKRVAKALIDIYKKYAGEKATPVTLDISREDIAQYVGTATESLIRTLSDFKSEKLIDIREGKIRIADLQKLENLVY